ncbi:MAG: hypothetical protein R2697_08950 [Ilumatobacteraceae bacterium]
MPVAGRVFCFDVNWKVRSLLGMTTLSDSCRPVWRLRGRASPLADGAGGQQRGVVVLFDPHRDRRVVV